MNDFGNLSFAAGNPLFAGSESHNLQQFLNVQASDSHREFTALRNPSPHSDKLDSPDTGIAMGDYPSHSPDHAATPSERDESPDTVSSVTSNSHDVDNDVKPLNMSMSGEVKVSPEDQELQRQIFRLTGMDGSSLGLLKQDIKSEPSSTPTLSQTLGTPSFQQQLQSLIKQHQQLQQAPIISGNLTPGVPLGASMSTHTTAITTNPDGTPTPQKRKRQRRNPVWPYFDVIDGTARCKQCLYSTKSVFSTNLKVHLRSHHRADYEKVIEAEDALNLNALLLSGNSGSFLGRGTQKRNLPPMTSSILQTINKLANQSANAQDGQSTVLNSALQQALAAGTLQQQMLQAQAAARAMPQFNLQAAAAQLQANLMANKQLANALAVQQNQQVQQQAQMRQAQQAAVAQHQQSHQPQQQTSSVPPSQAPTPTPQTPSAPLSAEQFNLNFNGGLSNPVNSASTPVEMPQPKRRRLRRHPVWMFFRDLEDRMVGCINCNFRTGSAFSTNLKMHLKAHHKDDYAKVLKLEDEMRIEEGILGPPNKIKSELIDFIRGGGNASQMVGGVYSSSTAPRPSPLVQQFISQTLSGNASPSPQPTPPTSQGPPTMVNQKNGATADIVTGAALDEDTLTKLSMGDRLAALVGLQKPDYEGEENSQSNSADHAPSDILARLGLLTSQMNGQQVTKMPQQNAFEELRRAAERIAVANIGLNGLSGLQMNGRNGNNEGCGMSDTKTSSSASTDGEDSRRNERDRALVRLAHENETLLSSETFKEFVRTLCPDYELPSADQLAEMTSEQYCYQQREEDELTNEHDLSEEHDNEELDVSGNGDDQDYRPQEPIEIHMPALLQ